MSNTITKAPMPRRMEKTTCFRTTEHLDSLLKKISQASGVPVSSLIRHLLLTGSQPLAKQYGIDVNKD